MAKFDRIMTCGIYLLLGSNLGDKLKHLNDAIDEIGKIVTVKKTSAVYETAAWGKTEQPTFYNLVVEVCTELIPAELLKHLLAIEQQLGRVRFEKWGPRTIDIDILYYRDLLICETDLIVPHPGIPDRKFTLVPLNEIAPNFINVSTGLSNNAMLEALVDDLPVEQIKYS